MSFQALVRQGRFVAIISQLMLIVSALMVFRYELAGWQVLPNFVLLAVLMARSRFAAWFALVIAVAVALLQVPQVPVDWSPKTLYLLMWGLTVIGLTLNIVGRSSEGERVGETPRNISGIAAWGVRVLLLLVVILTCSAFAAIGRRDGVAPDSDFDSRRAWGERVLGPYLDHIDTWVAQADLIRRDIGSIQGIAPIGSPNRYHPGFTDGQYATMNLEVIGTTGTGELYLPYVEIWSTGQLRSIGDEARWRFGGEQHLIAKSGKSYLAEHGFEKLYVELLALANKDAAEEFVNRWNDFAEALAATSLRSGGSRTGKPRLMPVLHDHYRQPMLIHLGKALADVGKNNEGAEAYRQSAELNLWHANGLLQERDGQRDLTRVADEIRRANDLLRRANQLVPDNQSTLRLARERVALKYLHSIGGRPEPFESEDGKRDQPWAEKCLGMFFREAVAYARRSPYLKRTLGDIRSVRIAPNATSELVVNDHDVYEGTVFLDVAGKKGHGRLLVTVRENHRRCTPIDLFSATPRRPDYPLTLRTPSWTPDSGEWVKLSAKTGELQDRS